MIKRTAAILIVAFSPVFSNSLSDGTANAVVQWNDAILTAIKTTATPPTVASRALFIVHSAIYDAWAAYDPTASPSVSGAPPRQPADSQTVANKTWALSYAAYRTALDLFPTQEPSFTMLMINLGYDPSIKTTALTSPAGVGNAAAAAQIAIRHSDGSNQLGDLGGNGPYTDYTNYTPVNFPETMNDPAHWQPLRNPDGTVQKFLSPFWGQVAPFALTSGNQFRPGPPPQAGTWLYQQRMNDAIQRVANLDDRGKMSVEYWNDNTGVTETPPGHWNRIAEDISARDLNTLDRDVQMYFVLNASQHDASVAVWDAKRTYDYIRPISAIRYFMAGQTVQGWAGPANGFTSIDAGTWQPWIGTPPHPEYPSGHSAYSNAAAEVLRRFTGSDTYNKSVTFPAGSSGVDPGNSPQNDVTLSWQTFSEVAEDAATSRRIGGIHNDEAELRSRILGREVGIAVWNRFTQLLSGTTQ
ncbi:MAG TPA: vanadium-dependent haloperoxidase [Bryobacteraceae bacterium]|nr:vanadium-dependent haloperoxidase [Bryobacteraceae bacterium]